MLHVETVELGARGVSFPHDRVGMVIAQPYVPVANLTVAEPYRFTIAAAAQQLPVLQRTLALSRDSHHGLAHRPLAGAARFLGLGLDEAPPEHSTISRTRRLIDLETHRAFFTWILQVLAGRISSKGRRSASMRPRWANAALRSVVRRDSGETYQEFLTRLAQASGIETPTVALAGGDLDAGSTK